jgi:hypothetical protein
MYLGNAMLLLLLMLMLLLLTSAAAQPPTCGDKDDWCSAACADQSTEKHLHVVPGGQDCLCSCEVSACHASTWCYELGICAALTFPGHAGERMDMTGARISHCQR